MASPSTACRPARFRWFLPTRAQVAAVPTRPGRLPRWPRSCHASPRRKPMASRVRRIPAKSQRLSPFLRRPKHRSSRGSTSASAVAAQCSEGVVMNLVKVASLRRETPEIISLDLVPADGRALPPAPPGSHIDVAIGAKSGLGTLTLRQYSLCQAPGETDRYRIGVKREPNSRGGSIWLHEAVREGDELQVGVPRDNFAPSKDADFHLLVAGGIGITPMLSVAQHLHEAGK